MSKFECLSKIKFNQMSTVENKIKDIHMSLFNYYWDVCCAQSNNDKLFCVYIVHVYDFSKKVAYINMRVKC